MHIKLLILSLFVSPASVCVPMASIYIYYYNIIFAKRLFHIARLTMMLDIHVSMYLSTYNVTIDGTNFINCLHDPPYAKSTR